MKPTTPQAGMDFPILALMLLFQLAGHATSHAEPESEAIASANGKSTLVTGP